MKRSFSLPSYARAFTDVRRIEMFPGEAVWKSKLVMKGKFSGEPVKVLGLL